MIWYMMCEKWCTRYKTSSTIQSTWRTALTLPSSQWSSHGGVNSVYGVEGMLLPNHDVLLKKSRKTFIKSLLLRVDDVHAVIWDDECKQWILSFFSGSYNWSHILRKQKWNNHFIHVSLNFAKSEKRSKITASLICYITELQIHSQLPSMILNIVNLQDYTN